MTTFSDIAETVADELYVLKRRIEKILRGERFSGYVMKVNRKGDFLGYEKVSNGDFASVQAVVEGRIQSRFGNKVNLMRATVAPNLVQYPFKNYNSRGAAYIVRAD